MSIKKVTGNNEDRQLSWRRLPRRRQAVATTRTTLAIDVDLLAAIDAEVRSGHATSRAAFVNDALAAELRARERAAIDQTIRSLAQDPAYDADQDALMDEFRLADREELPDDPYPA